MNIKIFNGVSGTLKATHNMKIVNKEIKLLNLVMVAIWSSLAKLIFLKSIQRKIHSNHTMRRSVVAKLKKTDIQQSSALPILVAVLDGPFLTYRSVDEDPPFHTLAKD